MKKTIVVVGNNPDLIISEFKLLPSKPTQGKPFGVRVGIYNQGSAPSNAFTVEWWPGERYARSAYSWRVNGLPANGGKILTCSYKGYPSGYSKISTRVVADSKGEVKEQNERNNDKIVAISVLRVSGNTIDLRPQMTPLVESQGIRNTCSVFAATALMEFLIRAKSGRTMNLSEAYNYWAAKKYTLNNASLRNTYRHQDGLAGFLAVEAYRYGSMLESEWPYELRNWEQKRDARCKTVNNRTIMECFTGVPPTGAKRLPYKITPIYIDRKQIANFIQKEKKPVVLNILWCSGAVNSRTGDIRMPTKVDLKKAQGHVILLVGYNSQTKRFIYRNSGGPGWGNNGYGTIPEQYVFDHCEICPKLSDLKNVSPERRQMLLNASKGISGRLDPA